MEVRYTAAAQRDLRKLPAEAGAAVRARLAALAAGADNLDVQRVKGRAGAYRLRVGRYRAIFERTRNAILVYGVAHRREVYR